MGRTTTQMELVSITKLVPYVNNARTHSPEQIMKLRSSLREFGFINPVIIDKDYGIIAGHGRVMAAKEEGIDEVPCVFVDYLTEAQKKAYMHFQASCTAPSAVTFTAESHGTTEVNIPSFGVAAPGWNTVREPAMPIRYRNPNFRTLW